MAGVRSVAAWRAAVWALAAAAVAVGANFVDLFSSNWASEIRLEITPISEAFFSWAVTRNVLGEMTHLTSDKLSSNASGCKLALAVERDKSFEARRIRQTAQFVQFDEAALLKRE